MPEDNPVDPKPAATQTTPAGHEIPVPERDDFLRNLEKVAPPATEADEDA